ncbi:MAG TPA: response regulator [Longimicrobiales bacterium]|nr:response regulator [Longimicrobiales bacterium]
MQTTVLLVEPHPEARDIFATVLRHAGYDVLEARNGEEAMRLALERQPHLVVCGFPVLLPTGGQLGEALRRHAATSTVPILAVTSHVFPEDLERARRSGVDEVLPKPVALARLLEVVERLAGPAARPDA